MPGGGGSSPSKQVKTGASKYDLDDFDDLDDSNTGKEEKKPAVMSVGGVTKSVISSSGSNRGVKRSVSGSSAPSTDVRRLLITFPKVGLCILCVFPSMLRECIQCMVYTSIRAMRFLVS